MTAKRLFLSLALTGLVGLAVGTSSAQAGSVVLGTSGWTASWNDTSAEAFTVAVLSVGEAGDRVMIKKVASIGPAQVDNTGAIMPIDVAFTQTSADAKQLTVINSEFITNHTGKAWTSFTMSLIDATNGVNGSAVFDPAATGTFNSSGGFNIRPFQNGAFSALSVNNQVLTLTGGTVPTGPSPSNDNSNVFTPGGGGTLGQLVINANPIRSGGFKTFVLREQPNVGPTPPPIPLPAAAWTGLSGLIGLGLVSGLRKLRGLIQH